MKTIRCVEGVPFLLDPAYLPGLQRAITLLRAELRPRFPLLKIDEDGCRILNLVGSIDIGPAIVEVEPKTRPGEDWIAGALSLIAGYDRIMAGGDRVSGLSEHRPSLWEALATRYVARLELALHREGPLLVFSEHRERDTTIRGRLDVHAWFDKLPDSLTHLPLVVRQLSSDNDFSRAMAKVAIAMSRTVHSPVLRARLIEAANRLRPGFPEATSLPPGIEGSPLPTQWGIYRPAWSIAVAILRRRSLLAPSGSSRGIAVAFEAWPLLERLLSRALASAVTQASTLRPFLTSHSQEEITLLRPEGGPYRAHRVRPDGLLREGSVPIATFEAKYRDFDPAKGPKREEIYQAVSTAMAVGAPKAFLVYPNGLPNGEWTIVSDMNGPTRLYAMGLRMFSYRNGDEESIGRSVLEICS